MAQVSLSPVDVLLKTPVNLQIAVITDLWSVGKLY